MRMTTLAGGFSLVEVLAALTVLSVGMLGVAGLYLESLSSQRTAILRAQAVNLAADMAERIRTNRNAGIYGDAYELGSDHSPLAQACVAATLMCTQTALARDDLSRWLVAIHNTLPGDGELTPSGTVAVNTGTVPTTYTITVRWSEPGSQDSYSYTLTLQA